MKPEWIAAAGIVSAILMAVSIVTFIVSDMLRDWSERIADGARESDPAREVSG